MSNKKSPTVRIVTATEAQNKFGAMLRRAYAVAEHLIIERNGIPVAALIPIADYQQLVPQTSTSRVAPHVATASQRERAAREMKEFLARVHAEMPDIPEAEAESMINEAVAEVRYGKHRARRSTRARNSK